ncbi:hypothetical protein TUM19329_01660 [Legionella antarctica]|uniref:Uncharacterized protein n=1 Tax=Legionella antarctica TaxID=2708020 RepID=A0A6F8SZH5_9GAMM|nr:hypothetical protein [Legionella antarctica]BCA93805.1 hypothetical protein TUM19329_01660 [Legionella antarctica]
MKAAMMGILLFFAPLLATAQSMPPKLDSLFRIAISDHINKTMHDEFWSELQKYDDKNEIKKATESMKMGLLPAQEMQQEIWESAQISYHNNKVVKTQKLIELEKEIPNKMKNLYPYDKNSSNYAIAVKAFDEQYALARKNTLLLLEASASHRHQFFSAEGQSFALSEDIINKTASNLSQSTKRIKILLTEEWDQEQASLANQK